MKERPGYFSAGEGPAVVLLHCSLSSKNQWRGLSSILAPRHRVIALDLYGYGETPMPAEQERFTLLDEAELVSSLLDELIPGEGFHVVGHSYGGAVALALAHQRQAQARSLTLFEPVAFHLLQPDQPQLRPVHDMVRKLDSFLAAGHPSDAARTFVDYWSGPGAFEAYPPRVQKDFSGRTRKLQLDFRALTQTPLSRQDYRKLVLPVTLIAGKSSKSPSLCVTEVLSQTLPDNKLIWVETGHMGPVTDPVPVNEVISKSLA